MKALGLVSLLLALALVAVLAKKQLSASHPASANASAVAASQAGVDLPEVSNAEQARRLQDQVKDDVNQLMQNRASQVDAGTGEDHHQP